MDRRHEIENLWRSIAMLTPGAANALNREQALALYDELQQVTNRLDRLKHQLRELADEG